MKLMESALRIVKLTLLTRVWNVILSSTELSGPLWWVIMFIYTKPPECVDIIHCTS